MFAMQTTHQSSARSAARGQRLSALQPGLAAPLRRGRAVQASRPSSKVVRVAAQAVSVSDKQAAAMSANTCARDAELGIQEVNKVRPLAAAFMQLPPVFSAPGS